MIGKKVAPVLALGLSFGALISAERPDLYEEAAHIPPEACRDEIVSALGSEALSQAIRVDIQNSAEANSPTNAENNKRVSSDLLEGYPLLADYIKYPEAKTETYTTPDSGLIINITRIQNDYIFSPENFDFILRSVYSREFEDDALRTATYDCYRREIFQNNALEGREIDVYLIGSGELCLGRKKVVPRGMDPNLCTAQGRHRSDGIYVLSPNPRIASYTIMHEIGGHEAQDAMDSVPSDDKEFEYFAYELTKEAKEIMSETDRYIFYAQPDSTTD